MYIQFTDSHRIKGQNEELMLWTHLSESGNFVIRLVSCTMGKGHVAALRANGTASAGSTSATSSEQWF